MEESDKSSHNFLMNIIKNQRLDATVVTDIGQIQETNLLQINYLPLLVSNTHTRTHTGCTTVERAGSWKGVNESDS